MPLDDAKRYFDVVAMTGEYNRLRVVLFQCSPASELLYTVPAPLDKYSIPSLAQKLLTCAPCNPVLISCHCALAVSDRITNTIHLETPEKRVSFTILSLGSDSALVGEI